MKMKHLSSRLIVTAMMSISFLIIPTIVLASNDATVIVNKNQPYGYEYTSYYSGIGLNYDYREYCQSSYIFIDSTWNHKYDYFTTTENNQTACSTNITNIKYKCIEVDGNGCRITQGIINKGPQTDCYQAPQTYLGKISDGNGLMAASTGSILPTNSPLKNK